jgi:hypothetical protein
VKIRKVRTGPDSFQYQFICPGCKIEHAFNDKTWKFNADMDKPTLSPSYLIKGARFTGKRSSEKQVRFRCHSQIQDGNIRFYKDSTHKLSGSTVALPDYEDKRM